MSEWKEYRLGNAPLTIIDGDRGKNYPNQNEFQNSGYCLFLSTKNVRLTGFDFADCQFISKEKDEVLRKGKLNRNDLVLTTRGTVGNIGFYSNKVNFDNIRINSGMVIIRPNTEQLDPKFNYYVFRFLQKDFLTYTTGSAQPQLPIRDLNEIDIKLPPLPEQTAIASVLSSLDDKIDLLHRQNATLEKMAETLFRQWFVEEAKEDWACVKIGDFVSTNVSTITKNYPFEKVEYLDTSSLNEGMIGQLQKLNLIDAPSRAKRLVKHNDILLSTVRPDQKHYGIIKQPKKNLVVSTGFCVITCHSISPHFTYLLLTTSEMTEFLHSIAEGSTSTYPSLKPSDIEMVEFLLPPENKMNEFEKIASNYWNK
jgi:type I restriction enzyme S subunit